MTVLIELSAAMWCCGQVVYLTTSHTYTCDGRTTALSGGGEPQSESEVDEAQASKFDPGGARACRCKARWLGRTPVPIAHHSVMTL